MANAYFCKWYSPKSSGMFVINRQLNESMQQCGDSCEYVQTHTLVKHTHTLIPPGADLSSSCSFLLGTLKPVHVSQCPSPWSPLSPSLPFCHIWCISASFPYFCPIPPLFTLSLLTLALCLLSDISSLWTKWIFILFSFYLVLTLSSSCCITKILFHLSAACNPTVTINLLFMPFYSIAFLH